MPVLTVAMCPVTKGHQQQPGLELGADNVTTHDESTLDDIWITLYQHTRFSIDQVEVDELQAPAQQQPRVHFFEPIDSYVDQLNPRLRPQPPPLIP